MAMEWDDVLMSGFGSLGGLLGGLFSSKPQLSADEIENMQVNGTAFDQIALDPYAMDAVRRALAQMGQVADQQGMDLQSKVALRQAQQDNAGREQMQRQAILQNMAQRAPGGQGVQGAEYAAQLANQQGAAQSNAMAGSQAASDARKRALMAMQGAGQLGLGARGQQYGEAAARAQSKDAIEQFNARQRGLGYMANAGFDVGNRDWNTNFGYGAGKMAGTVAAAFDPFGSQKKKKDEGVA